ncbi:tRNA pseudouridine(55) synthase TruB [Deferrisoma palaeochoriense]
MSVPGAGLLVVRKPPGPTSHTTVARVRRALGADKAGHAGTLDPFASGVLLVGLGRATRLLEYLVGHPKTYRARVRLGEERDTLDRTGELLRSAPVPPLDLAELEALLARFRGRITQVPPAHSAIKVGGEALYRKARRGEEVAPPPRTVEIFRLDLVAWRPPDLDLEVECSAGTYVRSLARDIGAAAGSGAVLWELVRTRSGPFGLDEAMDLEEVERLGPDAWDRVLPPERMVAALSRADVGPAEAQRILHGTAVPWEGPDAPALAVFGPDGTLLAVARADAGLLWPTKVVGGPEGWNARKLS